MSTSFCVTEKPDLKLSIAPLASLLTFQLQLDNLSLQYWHLPTWELGSFSEIKDSQLIRDIPIIRGKFLPGSSKGRAAPQGRMSQEHRTTVPRQSRCNSILSQQIRKNRVLITSPIKSLRHGSVMNHQDPPRESMQEEQKTGQETTYLQHRSNLQPSRRQDKRLSSSVAQTRSVCLGPSLNGAPGPMGRGLGGAPGEAAQGN